TAPCKTACPAHIAVQGYLKLASQGKYTEALGLIKKENPLPAICGRICNRKCEDACTRATVDEAVAIDEVKRFVSEQDLNEKTRYIPKKIIPSTRGEFSQKIAIIGGGPAGLSCAYFLALSGYRPTIFEKNPYPGGMLRYGIPSYKLEKEVIDAEIEVIKELGVEIKCNVEVGKDITIQQLREEGYLGFYLAIGCQGSRKANIENEDAKNVLSAVDFLHKVTDDENTKVKGNSVVIGGGNVAIDVARTALRCGSKDVQMYCLESQSQMPASKEEQDEATSEGVKINCGWGIKEIKVNNGKVCAVVLKQCVSVFDDNGKFAPTYDENNTTEVKCDNLFLSIGQSIDYKDLLKGENIEFGRGNAPIADAITYQTTQEDIFVGGDVYTGPSFAIDAIAAGKQGAESLHRYVHENASLTIGRDARYYVELDKDNISIESYDNGSRQKPLNKHSVELSFRDNSVSLTSEQVKKETARCLNCGVSVVDTNKCIGCGICTTKCEFDAIKLSRMNPDASRMVRNEDKLKVILPNLIKRQFKIMMNKKK
ncbi:MAG: FAD-dependent oxidoreductase, partial [Erysipelotrichaceae bacterium]